MTIVKESGKLSKVLVLSAKDNSNSNLSGSSQLSSSTSSCSNSSSGDENTGRGNWSGKLDFLLSCIGYAVGLGNIWRFPYLCYRNGGGAFLIPYVTFLLLCGVPLFFLEVSYGQFSSLSPITAWRLSPLFKGVGYGMLIISGIVCVYYNVIIAWALYYLFMSFRAILPWSTCGNYWNTEACSISTGSQLANETGISVNGSLVNGSLIESEGYSIIDNFSGNLTNGSILEAVKRVSPSEEYWERHVLELSSGIEDMGEIRWQLLISLTAAWVLVFFCLIKGIKSSGRIVYFTATFPYVVLFILLIRGVTLPGAVDGLKFYLIPKWHKLLELKVWGEAAMQIFYSVGAAWGALVTMASYNKFHHNCYRDAFIVPMMNCGTSIFAGLVIFSVIGFMAHQTNSTIEDVVTHGPGLVFVVYPEAVTKLPISPIWSILFFMMLLSVGLGSQFAMFQTVISGIVDEFPKYLSNRKVLLTAVLCVVEFLLGVPCITKGGIYFLQIMDWYSSTFSLMILSLTECLVIGWIYGVDNYYRDIELMIGYKPIRIFKYMWKIVTPLTIMFILGFTICNHSPVTYGDYSYPDWAIVIGWFFALCSIVPLPLVAIISILKGKGSLVERVKELIKPSPRWGPALDMYREQYIATLKGDARDRVLPSTLSQIPLCKSPVSEKPAVEGIPPNQQALLNSTEAANAIV